MAKSSSFVDWATVIGPARSPLYEAAVISGSLAPVSLARTIALLEDELGEQGTESSALISRTHFYEEVAARADSIRAKVQGRHAEFYGAHNEYSRRIIGLTGFCHVVDLLRGTGCVVVILLGSYLLAAHYDHATSPQLATSVFWVAIVVAVATQLPVRMYNRAVNRLLDGLAAEERPLDEQLSREFHAVLLDLLRTSVENRLEPLLVSAEAPTLVEIGSSRIIPSESFRTVEDFLRRHVTSAVGLAGHRGAGKSTLLRWLVYALDSDWIPVYITAPATYDATDFMRVIFSETVSAIISRYEPEISAQAGSRASQVVRVLRPQAPTSADEIVLNSYRALEMLTGTRSNQKTTTAGLSGKGISLQSDRQTSWAERERTHPELTAAFKRYLEGYQRLGGGQIMIAVDELDKLTSADEAIAAINGLKDLFHLSHTHFVVSVSEDALRRFAMRGIPVRDVFDSAFDEIIRVRPPSTDDAWKMLAYRVSGFPMSIALFCYAWAGGLPRDIIRAARACVAERRRLARPVGVADVAPLVVRQDLAEAIDAAIGASLDGEKGMDVRELVKARRRLDQDESGLATGLLPGADTENAMAWGEDVPHGVVIRQSLSVYADLGATMVEYFGKDFDTRLARDPDTTLTLVADLARARAELGSYPPDARWWLNRAQTTISPEPS